MPGRPGHGGADRGDHHDAGHARHDVRGAVLVEADLTGQTRRRPDRRRAGALQGDRAKLNRYVASLNSPSVVSGYAQWSCDQKKAFWLNAYNALVLQTVVDHYPIHGTAKEYPPNSVRQIPGAFERTPHAIAASRSAQ